MYVDYKMPHIKITGDKTRIKVVIYKGKIATQDEPDADGSMQPITRYRRTAKIKTITRTLNGVFTEEQIRRKINKQLKIEADAIGIPVITEQSDTSDA